MTSDPTALRRLNVFPRCRVVLVIVALAVLGLAVVLWLTRTGGTPVPPSGPTVLWMFEQPHSGAIISTPTVTADGICIAAIRDNALAPSGVVSSLDRRDGAVRWTFDDGGSMLHTISTPCLADGRLYVGEGMHGNDVCKMYCLDASSGRKLWQFVTGGHIESSPCVADGAVFFGSGDDGIYCLDAVTGAKRWQFAGPWHIDASPVVVDGRLYSGSGVSRLHQRTEIFCLNAANGQPRWRTPTELPVWGSPAIHGGQVFFGTGSGRLTQSAESPETPAGARLRRRRDGTPLLGRSSRGCDLRPSRRGRGARLLWGADGRCYCLDRQDGRRLWQADMGSPIVTRPALIDGRLYVVASGGRISCLDAANGQGLWTFDVAGHTQTRPQLLSSPVVVADGEGTHPHHLIYFGTELRNGIRSAAVLYCLRD